MPQPSLNEYFVYDKSSGELVPYPQAASAPGFDIANEILFDPSGNKYVGTALAGAIRANSGKFDVAGALIGGAIAYFVPVIGAEIGSSLLASGALAAGTSAATATAVGTAIASSAVQVAQGVPVDKAVQNATVNAVVQTQTPGVATEIAKVTEMPGFSDAITSAGASYAATLAKGGTAEQAAQNALGGVVGSITGTATESKELGAAAGILGAGGTAEQAAAAGAGAYATGQTAADAATARKEIAATEAAQDAPVITGDSGGVASVDKPMIDLVQKDIGQGAATSSLPEVTVTASPSADVGVQPVVTDVVSRPTSGTLPEVSVTASQDNEPGIQPVTTDTQTAKKDTSVAPTNMGTLSTVQVTGTTDDEGIQPVTDVATVDKTTPTTDATQATDKTVEDDKTDTTATDDEDQYLTVLSGTGTPKTKTRTRTDLSTTLQAPFYPSSTLGQALTGYRGAGEIEGKKTGKPRKDVWNEESLRLKDALGL